MGTGLSYYDILGLARNADDTEIKKAYRRLALKYHPETDSTEEAIQEFARINEAYDVLSNPKTKGCYDLYGEEALKAGQDGEPPYAFDSSSGPSRVFKRFFGTANPYEALNTLSSHFEKLTTTQHKEPGQAKTYELHVSLEELYHGCTKGVQHTRRAVSELGEVSLEQHTLKVAVAAGALDGTQYIFQGQGGSTPKNPPGPVIVLLSSRQHPVFFRQGSDLVHKVKLPLYQALAGGSVSISALDGRVLCIPLDEVVTPGHTVVVPGEGMPKPGGASKGDLVLEFDLVFPACLTQQQKMLLKASLYLPAKPDEVQGKALRSFEAAFKDAVHGWSTGVVKEEGGPGAA